MDCKLELVLIPVSGFGTAITSPTRTATSGSCRKSTAARADHGSFG